MAPSILVVSRSPGLASAVSTALHDAEQDGVTLDRAPSVELALRILTGAEKEIGAIVIDLAEETDFRTLLDGLRASGTRVPVYAAASIRPGSEAAATAARAAGCRVFRHAGDLPKQLVEDGSLRAGRTAAKLVLFSPAQEGSGASSTALHVANALAQKHGLRTLFVELDYHSDSVACRLRLENVKSLADLGPAEDWRAAIARWGDLYLLAAPTSTRLVRQQGVHDLSHILGETSPDYDIVIGDLPCNTVAVSPRALQMAARVYVVATAEVTSLYLARRRILELATAGVDRNVIKLIINRDRPGAVDSDLAEQVTGLTPACRLPNDYPAASEAETEGRTVNHASTLGRAYLRLADKVAGKPAVSTETNRWGRLVATWR